MNAEPVVMSAVRQTIGHIAMSGRHQLGETTLDGSIAQGTCFCVKEHNFYLSSEAPTK